MSLIQRFFEPAAEINYISSDDYLQTIHHYYCLTKISAMENQSIYVIDYYRRTIDFVTSHPLFLCGYSPEEVKNFGVDFFEKVVPADDLKMILEIHEKTLAFFYQQPFEDRNRIHLVFDFRLKRPDGSMILVNQIAHPMLLSSEGHPWIMVCLVNISPNRHQGNVIIRLTDEKIQYSYSFQLKKFLCMEAIAFSPREKQVLRFMKSGYTEEETAGIMHITVNTVKYHKKNICRKTGAKNMKHVIALVRRLNVV